MFVFVSIIALQPSRESYTGLPFATTMLPSEEQPTKAALPIFVTDSGIVILLSDAQRKKAAYPISVTDSGITILSSVRQSSKA